MFKQFKFKLFLKLFIFYVVSIMLPFIITSLFLSQYVINTYKNNVFSLYDNITDHISSVMDSNLYDIESAAINLASSSNLLNASANVGTSVPDAVYDLVLLQRELSLHKSYQNTTGQMDIFLGSQQILVSANNKLSVLEYYERYFSDSAMTYEDFLITLNSGGDKSILLSNADTSNSITVLRPLFKDIYGNNVTLLATIETTSVFENFSNMTGDLSKAYFVIADDKAPLLKSRNTPDVVSWESFLASDKSGFIKCDGDFLALKTKSILPTLNYVYIISEGEILAKVNFTQTLLAIMIFIVLLILFVAAYLISCRSFSPVAALISSSNDGNCYYKLDSYDDISVLVTDTINTNNSLRSTIDRQRKCINDNLFIMFLQNSMDMNKQALDMLFADVKPELTKPFYNVILLSIFNYSDLPADVARLSAVENMRRLLEENEILFTLIPSDTDRIIVLANHSGTQQTLASALKKFISDLKNNIGIEISMNVGRQFDNLNMFSKSYEDALYSSTQNRGQLVFGSGSEKDIKNIFFTAEDKKHLENYVLSGDGASVLSFFENLMSKIFIENTLTYRILSYIRYSLMDTLSEIIYKSSPDDELDKILAECRLALEGHNFMNSFKSIADCFLKTVDTLNKIKNAPSNELRGTLVNYINKNYANPDISLTLIAKELHFSYSYLCKFFKKEMGCVFLDYLHQIRIEHAKEQLAESGKSITEIAESLGYLSSNTFIKTFKKYEGISPGEYRKNLKE